MRMKKLGQMLEQIPRTGVALLAWGILFIIIHLLTTVWLATDPRFGWAIWAIVMAFSVRPFMVSVSEYTALVTINLLTGGLKDYGTGLWFRYPWEQAKEGNYINLRLLPLSREENYPAQDGPLMHAKWQAPYKVVNAIVYIGVGRAGVEEIIGNAGSGVLSAYIAKNTAEGSKNNQEGAEQALQAKFQTMTLGVKCGIEVPVVSLADLDYEPEVQRVLVTEFVAKKIKKIGEDLREGEKISAKDSQNSAMILHGDVTKHINEVEGEGGNALAALLMAMAQGGSGQKGGGK